MKIDFLVGHNNYSTTAHFAKKFSEAMLRAGISTRLFWVGDEQFYHAFYAISANPPDLICSFSDITVGNNVSLGKMWGIPFLSILVDPAIYFLHHCNGSSNWISCVDEGDCDMIRSLAFNQVFFLPHGVENEGWVDPSTDRPFPISFFGSCIDFEMIAAQWLNQYGKKNTQNLLEASLKVLTPDGTSIFKALRDLGVPEEELIIFHYEVDRYIRGRDRVELLRQFKGMNLHVWGDGPWDKYIPWAAIHHQIPFSEALKMMELSEVILSSSPRFKQGQHERILYGYQKGCVPMTGENPYIVKSFGSVNIPTYQHGNWAQAADAVNTLLSNRQLRIVRSKAGQEIVQQGHTWDVRVPVLVNTLSQLF